MAAAPEGGDDAELVPGPKKHDDEQTQSLEKVTDYVEEKETATGELGQVGVRHINWCQSGHDKPCSFQGFIVMEEGLQLVFV